MSTHDRKPARRFYRRYLPHYDPHDAPYSVTYRLAGSIPKAHVERLRQLYLNARSESDRWKFFIEFDKVLDTNKEGPHYLADSRVREIVMDSLDYLHSNKIVELHTFTVMSNHVHAVFDLISQDPLFRVMQSHKSFTAREANKLLGRRGRFWQPEGFDHVIREGRFGSIVGYVLRNPVNAGLVNHWSEWPGTYLAPNIYGFE